MASDPSVFQADLVMCSHTDIRWIVCNCGNNLHLVVPESSSHTSDMFYTTAQSPVQYVFCINLCWLYSPPCDAMMEKANQLIREK